MARLMTLALASLDGYVADEHGDFSWATPDAQVHSAVNDVHRSVGTLLLGRRVYEVLRAWEDLDLDGMPAEIVDFAGLWAGMDKVVFSTTLPEPSTARTRIERSFDPDEVRRWVADSQHDLLIGGPTLTATAVRAGLVDDWHVYLHPIAVGAGLSLWSPGVVVPLRLAGQRLFDSGVAYLHHQRVAAGPVLAATDDHP